ncbi:MAG: hypothetical protein M1827_006427 [Pycnora praestabilis]|nr:MAG: hypothetical protein M1827_006427 [Pycnora praestabilis]
MNANGVRSNVTGRFPASVAGIYLLSAPMPPIAVAMASRTPKFKQMNDHISSLQDQVDALFSNMNSLRTNPDSMSLTFDHGSHSRRPSRTLSLSQSSQNNLSPSSRRNMQPPKHPRFQGPTSSAFNFDVAKSSLQTMGITGTEDGVEDGVSTGGQALDSPSLPAESFHPNKDPLWMVTKHEAIRLCRVYEEEMGLMYPVLDIERTIQHATLLYSFIGAAARSGLAQMGLPGEDGIYDDDTNILKAILATALIVEGSGQSELGWRFYESVREFAESKMREPVEVKGLVLLAVISMFHFHRDEEALAWRTIGMTARMALEMGLHRRETLDKSFSTEEERTSAVKLFWCIYVLDRRWSFGTGMPFALQDSDIDSMLPEPGGSTPYLTVMTKYSRLGSKVWSYTLQHSTSLSPTIHKDEIGYLDYQTMQWFQNIPSSLKFLDPSTGQEVESTTRGMRRLRILLYLRANQMRIMIYRPVLHTLTSIMENRAYASTVVNLAKDTIRVLTHLNQTSDIYRVQQVCFNYFLVSALAVLFLSVSHAPAQFSTICRDEFYMALDLIKGFSTRSYISKRLWRTIKGLKEVGPKLGLLNRNSIGGSATTAVTAGGSGAGGNDNTESSPDAHSTAAAAMAGLAGHPVDDFPTYPHSIPAGQNLSPLGNSPLDGFQMSNELTALFEAVGGYGGVLQGGGGGSGGNGNHNRNGDDGEGEGAAAAAMEGGMNGFMGEGQGEMGAGPGAGDSGAFHGAAGGWVGDQEELSRIMKDLF